MAETGRAGSQRAGGARAAALACGILLAALCARDGVAAPHASRPGDCVAASLALLHRRDPVGFELVRRADDVRQYRRAIVCESSTYALEVAVHEMVHALDGQLAFWSPAETAVLAALVVAPDEAYFVPRSDDPPRSGILSYLPADGPEARYRTYLQGRSGGQGLWSLLEELNAYTLGGRTAQALAAYRGTRLRQSTRDGVSAFLLYLELYFRLARERKPTAWRAIVSDATQMQAVRRIWSAAEEFLSDTLDDPRLGLRDREILARVYEPARLDELSRAFAAAGEEPFEADPRVAEMAEATPATEPPEPDPTVEAELDERRRREGRVSRSAGRGHFEQQTRRTLRPPAEAWLRSILRTYPNLSTQPRFARALAFASRPTPRP